MRVRKKRNVVFHVVVSFQDFFHPTLAIGLSMKTFFVVTSLSLLDT